MNKKTITLFIGVVFIIAVIVTAAVSFFIRNDDNVNDAPVEVRVSITEEGFSPATVSIERGMTVVWVNETATTHQVGANPYPDASSLPELKSGDIAPGESYSYTFNASGTFGYADYTNPTTGGSVQVK